MNWAGESGRRKIDRYTLVLTLVMAALQSYGIANGLEGVSGLVANPGAVFRFSVVATLTGGTLFLVWLADQITTRGFGNGIALMLCAGFLTQVPEVVFGSLELVRQGAVSSNAVLIAAVLMVLLTVIVILVEKARCSVPVAFSLRGEIDIASVKAFDE